MARTLEHIQDELLVIRSQDGESDALEELIIRWRGRLRAHAWSLTRDVEAAADASQESWLAIVRGLNRLSDPALFGPWAYRIVTHKCADWTRARQRRRRLVSHAIDEGHGRAEEHPRDEDEADRLRAGLGRLEPDSRAILSLHYLEQLNVNQIAWSVCFLFSNMAVAMMKLWFWMQMDKNVVIREMKRLELQVATLAGIIKSRG